MSDTATTQNPGATPAAPAAQPSSTTATAAAPTTSPASGATPPASTPAAAGANPGDGTQATSPAAALMSELFTDLPEGMNVNQPLLEGVSGWAQKHNVPADAVKELASMYKNDSIGSYQQQAGAIQKMSEDWYNACQSDKEIGGLGGKDFEANKGLAANAVARFGDAELRDALISSGFANHPAFVRAWMKVGKAFGEDSTAPNLQNNGSGSRPPQSKEEAQAAALYGINNSVRN